MSYHRCLRAAPLKQARRDPSSRHASTQEAQIFCLWDPVESASDLSKSLANQNCDAPSRVFYDAESFELVNCRSNRLHAAHPTLGQEIRASVSRHRFRCGREPSAASAPVALQCCAFATAVSATCKPNT